MDVPLHYHYLFNIHVGTAARTFEIPLILVHLDWRSSFTLFCLC